MTKNMVANKTEPSRGATVRASSPKLIRQVIPSKGVPIMSSYGEYYQDGRSIDPDKHTQDPAEPEDVDDVPTIDVREIEGY